MKLVSNVIGIGPIIIIKDLLESFKENGYWKTLDKIDEELYNLELESG